MITPTKEFWEVFKSTEGALSCCESLAIMNIASQAPEGIYIELGTYHGKSAMSAMIGLKDGVFYLVDPIFSDDLVWALVYDTVNKLPQTYGIGIIFEYNTSVIVLTKHPFNYAYVFVDSGSHQDGLPMQEVKLLEDRMVQGGIICFHDYQSQFIEVGEAYDYLIRTGKYEPIHIDWNEIKGYVGKNDLEKGNSSWHHTEMEFPCFVGALKRK